MFNTIEALDHAKHQDLRLAKIPSFKFAENVSSVKLSFSELRMASRFYPIVFLGDDSCLPQAILSLETGKNACLDASGNWKIPYVPLYFRLYPFTLARIEDQEDRFALCLDPEADHFKPGMGDPLFTADGQPTEFIEKKVLETAKRYQQELDATQSRFNTLNEKGLIADKSFNYTVNQEEKKVGGFKGVDMEKLVTLDDKELADMVKDGTMGMIYEHNASLTNFNMFIKPPAQTPPVI